MKKKIMIVFGTRPEAIKMASLAKAFKLDRDLFETKICVTAQHREMLDQVLDFFKIKPDYDLDLMRPGQNLYMLTSLILSGLKEVLEDFQPDYVFVHGDTTTTMAASIAAFYFGSKICHVEAGLRTYNKLMPFPEEINRQITSRISDYHFAPTELSKANLLRENIPSDSIVVTGNTVIDTLLDSINQVKNIKSPIINNLRVSMKRFEEIILVTGHRRENHGDGFERICEALKRISFIRPQTLIVFPVHLNPKVQEPVNRWLKKLENVMLLEPLNYPEFIWVLNAAKIIITDSGGIQEEAPSLGKPVLVMRDETERVEAVEAGTAILVGSEVNKIVSETIDLLTNAKRFKSMVDLNNPYGDGKAVDRIIQFIKDH